MIKKVVLEQLIDLQLLHPSLLSFKLIILMFNDMTMLNFFKTDII